MKKRLLSFLLTLCLMLSLILPAGAATTKIVFTDVPKTAWYAGAAYAMVNAGITNGTGDGTTFEPNKKISRAEVMKLLAAAAATDAELASAKGLRLFSDVTTQWHAPYINWCAGNGITDGYDDGTYRPSATISRAEVAVSIARLAEVSDRIELTETKAETVYTDDAAIPESARQAVYLCQRAGILEGSGGAFNPGGALSRAETMAIMCRLLGVPPLSVNQIPEPPKTFAAPKSYSTTVAGIRVTVAEFNPQNGYKASAVLANNKLYSSENAANIVSRSNGVVAVNGAFFNCYTGGDLTTHATIINRGKLLRLDPANTPYKPTFVVDTNGKASIEFLTIHQTVSLIRDGQVLGTPLTNVGTNFALGEGDSTDMIYTREFGSVVPGTVANAAVADENGIVTKVYKGTTTNVPIPEKGFVLFERVVRHQWDTFLTTCEVGDKIERTLEYEGSSTQNVDVALSCGPTLVKNGQAYGSAATYAQEGFSEAKVVSASAGRMAIGVKADGTVVIASGTATMQKMSSVMAGLGCKTAMNLDGGASAALYANGWKISAGRNLSNMLIFSKA